MRYNNFDFLRLILALIVFLVHIYDLTLSDSFGLFSLLSSDFAVKCFFVLSGYFIFKSYDSDPRFLPYIRKRLFRIYPAYFFTILFFSIALFFVSFTPYEYFSITWLRYVVSNLFFLNFVSPSLPGVFENQVTSAVNGALWTLKIEVAFYFFVPFFYLVSRFFNKYFLVVFFYILSVAYTNYCLSGLDNGHVLAHQFPGQIRFFMVGALWFFIEAFVAKYRYVLFSAIMVFVLVSFSINLFEPLLYFFPLFCFGRCIKLPNIASLGDISYGVYIFHFPLIQLFYHRLVGDSPYISFVGLVFALFISAMCSWVFIEKRFLSPSNHYVIR